MARIPDQIIEQVREAHDVVDVVGRAVSLKKAGGGFKGLCPFHDEKTPSFTVHPGRQTFKCFGCGEGGNVFHFLMKTQGLNFPEAVRQLAAERGIEVPDSGPQDPEQDARMAAVHKALQLAHRYFVDSLQSEAGYEARAYLAKRGYDEAAVEEFGLGYAPDAWDGLQAAARKAGVSAQALLDAGLARPGQKGRGDYDTFRHRVMFPIADARGRLVTFAGRALAADEPAKYMNGPETPVFNKSRVVYYLHRAMEQMRRRDEAILMEGYTDVLMCHLHGFENAVAGMGTALTSNQARLIRRHAERVVLLYDSDAAGLKAAERALPILLEQGFEVRTALLPEGRDVDEVLLEDGPEALTAILADARDMLAFKLEVFATRFDLASPRGRAKASEDLLALVKHIQSPVERDQWVSAIADRLGSGTDSEAVYRREAARHVAAQQQQAAQQQPGASRRAGAPPAAPGVFPESGMVESLLPAPGAGPQPYDLPEPGLVDGPDGPEDHLPPPEPPPPPMSPFERAQAKLRAEQRALEELDLLAALFSDASLRDRIFRAVGPEEFTAPLRAGLYNDLLEAWGQGQEIEFGRVMSRHQADPEMSRLLASLPEDPTLAERVTCQIDHVERKRAADQHLRKVVRMAGGRQNAGVDPDDSYFGDDGVLDGDPGRTSLDRAPGGARAQAGDVDDTGGTEAF